MKTIFYNLHARKTDNLCNVARKNPITSSLWAELLPCCNGNTLWRLNQQLIEASIANVISRSLNQAPISFAVFIMKIALIFPKNVCKMYSIYWRCDESLLTSRKCCHKGENSHQTSSVHDCLSIQLLSELSEDPVNCARLCSCSRAAPTDRPTRFENENAASLTIQYRGSDSPQVRLGRASIYNELMLMMG